jgi:hypothetical protein
MFVTEPAGSTDSSSNPSPRFLHSYYLILQVDYSKPRSWSGADSEATPKSGKRQWLLSYFFFHPFLLYPYTGVEVFISFILNISQTVELLGRGIGPSQGRYLNTGQHKHRKTYTHIKHPCTEWDSNPRSPNTEKRIHTSNIHALSGIRTHDPGSERAKTVHALDRSATVTGLSYLQFWNGPRTQWVM